MTHEEALSDASLEAYVDNVKFYLNEMRSTIHDGLPSRNDLYLKVSLLSDLDAAEHQLGKVLL